MSKTIRFKKSNRTAGGDKFPRNTKGFVAADGGMRAPRRKKSTLYKRGDNYNLIYAKVKSGVGKKWSDVYSKLVDQAAKPDHRYSLDTLVDSMVDTGCVLGENGKPERRTRWGFHFPFYVHPTTGILTLPKKLQSPPRVRFSSRAKTYTVDGVTLVEEDGIWFRVSFAVFPFGSTEYVIDALLGQSKEQSLNRKWGANKDGFTIYCSAKESANSREIEKVLKSKEWNSSE